MNLIEDPGTRTRKDDFSFGLFPLKFCIPAKRRGGSLRLEYCRGIVPVEDFCPFPRTIELGFIIVAGTEGSFDDDP